MEDKTILEIIKIIEEFREDKNPPHKEYENTYADGWLDACNEILWAIQDLIDEE